MVGLDAVATLFTSPGHATTAPLHPSVHFTDPDLAGLVDDLAARDHGLVMLMGRGGVGKTTMAAAVAVALANEGFPVHLTSTDPAAHLTQTLKGGGLDNLQISRIDPGVETQRYREQVLAGEEPSLTSRDARCSRRISARRARKRSPSSRRSPASSARHEWKFVVVDTAPTGHTLLLLDATGSYDQETKRRLGTDMKITTPRLTRCCQRWCLANGQQRGQCSNDHRGPRMVAPCGPLSPAPARSPCARP